MSKQKVKLGDTPKTFAPAPVKFTKPNGEEAEIEVVYKYRTSKQFGEYLNGVYADAGEVPKSGDKVDFEALFQKTSDKNADHLLGCMESWDLDDKLNRESLQALANEIPAAAIALMSGYRLACVEGKLGN